MLALTITALDSRDTSGDGIGLTSWGGSYVYNDELYLVRFSSSQASRIYKIDSTDFSSAPTLEKTLSDLPQNGVNGLVRLPNGKWICGFTSSGDVKQDNQLYILNSSFNHETTIDYAGTQEFGIQDLTIGPNGEIYASGHGDNDETDLFRFRYDGSTLIQEWQFRFSNLSNQGMAYANGVFYTATRDTGPAMTVINARQILTYIFITTPPFFVAPRFQSRSLFQLRIAYKIIGIIWQNTFIAHQSKGSASLLIEIQPPPQIARQIHLPLFTSFLV